MFFRVPLLLALALFLSTPIFGQSQANTGNIEGRITDPNAASVPGGGPRTFLGERQIQLGVRFKF